MKKRLKRLTAVFVAFLTTAGLLIPGFGLPTFAVDSNITITNLGQTSYYFTAGGSSWTSAACSFSYNGTPVYCTEEAAAAAPTGTVYSSPAQMDDFYYSVLTYADAICGAYGATGTDKYFAVQYAIWGKYCTGTKRATTSGTDSDSVLVLATAQALYDHAVNYPLSASSDAARLNYTKTGGDYISGSTYVIATYNIDTNVALMPTVEAYSTAGVNAYFDGPTLYITIPLSALSGGYRAIVNLSGSRDVTGAYVYTHSGYQSMGILQTDTSSVSGTIEERQDAPLGSVEIYKTDASSGKGLAGAVFTVTNESTGSTFVLTTDSTGYGEIQNRLPIGSYTIKETKAPAGYALGGVTEWDHQQITDTMSTLTYHVTNALMTGQILLSKTAEGSTDLSGFKFRVTGTSTAGIAIDKTYTTDSSGNISAAGLPIGTYTVTELASTASAGYILPSAQNVTVTQNGTSDVSFHNTLMRGNLAIKKTAEGRTNLSGFKFRVQGTSTAGIAVDQTYTTDTSGNIAANNLPVGTYTVTEVASAASVGYILPSAQSVTVNQGSTTTASFSNTLMKGNLAIQKTAEGRTDLSGFAFRVNGTSAAGMAYDKTFTTDTAGHIAVNNLPIGTYTVTEVASAASAGYILPAAQSVSVTQNSTKTATFANTLMKGDIVIKKSAEGRTNLSGFAFRVAGTSTAGMKFDQTFTTDASGSISVENLPVGNYTVTEQNSAASAGYILANSQTVTVTQNGSTEADFQNTLMRGKIKIVKTAEERTEDLSGFTFVVSGTSTAGQIVNSTYTTGSDGTVVTDSLPVGTYTVTEQNTDASAGYILADAQNVTVAQDSTTEADFNNTLMRGKIKIVKTAEDRTDDLSGFSFMVSGTSTAGQIINQAYTTGSDGTVLSDDLPIGTYTVTELSSDASAGYILAEPQTVTITRGGTTEADFSNTLMRGKIKIVKTAEGRTGDLSGFTFMVSGVSVAGQTINCAYTTGSDGTVLSDDLPIGTYTVTELSSDASAGYVLDNPQTVLVVQNKTAEADFHNTLMKGSIRLTKTAEGRTDGNLADFQFCVTGTSIAGMKTDKTYTTDEHGSIQIEDLPIGDYTITEQDSAASTGYILANPQTVTVKQNQETDASFYNELMKGTIHITKTAEGRLDGSLAGFEFLISGTSIAGIKTDETYTTDSSGNVEISGLPVGGYSVTEVPSDASAGYILADPLSAEVTQNGITNLSFFNELLPKTGEMNWPSALGLVGGAAGLIALNAYLTKRRRRT